jgi:hypothetical protein
MDARFLEGGVEGGPLVALVGPVSGTYPGLITRDQRRTEAPGSMSAPTFPTRTVGGRYAQESLCLPRAVGPDRQVFEP